MEKPKNNNLVIVIAAVAATGGLLFGYDTGVIAGALPLIEREKGWNLAGDAYTVSWIVSAVLLGAVFGAMFSGKVTDILGRKKVNLITAVIFTLGSIGTGLAPSPAWLIVGRLLIGIAVGIASFTVPLYISEISPARSRGALVSLNQLAITLGLVLAFVCNSAFFISGKEEISTGLFEGWRVMFLIGLVPAFILAMGMLYVPETPRWLMTQGREEEARTVIRKISPLDDADKEIRDIKENMKQEEGGNWRELFAQWLRLPLIIGVGIFFFQQFSGINAVFYFAPKMFFMSGFGESAGILATLGLGIVNVLFTILSISLLDRLGRKPLLYIGFIGVIVCLGVLAFAFYQKEELGGALKWITMGGLFAYIAFFAISLGPLGWLLISEIYPVKIRGFAMSMCSLSHWIFNFIVSFTFLPLVLKFSPGPLPEQQSPVGVYCIYAAISVIGLIFAHKLIPETKGYTLEEIEAKWLAKKKS